METILDNVIFLKGWQDWFAGAAEEYAIDTESQLSICTRWYSHADAFKLNGCAAKASYWRCAYVIFVEA
jgi:hypothetical protein